MKNKSEIIQEFIEKVLNGGDIEATGDYFATTSSKKFLSRDKARA